MTRISGILPPKLHHFRTVWNNVSGADKCLPTMFERLRLEDDRLTEESDLSGSTVENALIAKQEIKRSKTQKSGNLLECFKCGKKEHVKKNCQNKPCAKYVEYCKKSYGCNNCKQKGHFFKDCTNNDDKSKPERNEGNQNYRVFISICLSTANVIELY